VPLAGKSASEIILEMMALTHWGPLDFLVIDMPPATSDIMMTVMSLEDGAPQALVVTTPERLSIAVARRTLELLKDSNVDVLGVLGNMYRPGGQLSLAGPENMARTYQVPFLGGLPFDTAVTKAIDKNDVSLLLASEFAKELRTIVKTTLL
jgi:ATP-binding protein involved in chromosome partitioning